MEDNQQQPSTETDNEKAARELDETMRRYNTPAESSKPVVSEVSDKSVIPNEPVQATLNTAPPATNSEAPYGRYQRGKKKGQPRLTPYVSAKGVSSVPAVQQPIKPAEPPKLSGMLISAGLFLMLVNLCLPLFFAFVNNLISKDKINPEQLKLTKDQLKELDPVCDAVMKQASVTGNPLVLLILGICTAMGLNYMVWKMKQPNVGTNPNPKKDETKTSNH